MKKHLLIFVLGALLCSCTSPKLDASGGVDCLLNTGDTRHDTFLYPENAAAQEKLREWMAHNESKRCLYTLSMYVPDLTLNFHKSRTTVYFGGDSVHISPLTLRQYRRDRTPEDDAFLKYLESIEPAKK